MSFDPNNEIEDSEILFRAFNYDQWDHSENRVTSGVFNSSGSVSVDRENGTGTTKSIARKLAKNSSLVIMAESK